MTPEQQKAKELVEKCEHINNRNSYGRRLKNFCIKDAKYVDEGGRNLCEKHFKKWFKNKYKTDYEAYRNPLNKK